MKDELNRSFIKFTREEGWKDIAIQELKDGDIFRAFDTLRESSSPPRVFYVFEDGTNIYLATSDPYITEGVWQINRVKLND